MRYLIGETRILSVVFAAKRNFFLGDDFFVPAVPLVDSLEELRITRPGISLANRCLILHSCCLRETKLAPHGEPCKRGSQLDLV